MTDFNEIYSLYFRDVYKYVLSISRDEMIAEEITQETFFKALKISINLMESANFMCGYVKLQKIHSSHTG